MVTFLTLHPMEFIFFNSSDLLEHLDMLLNSTLTISCYLRNFLNKAIGIIRFTLFYKFYRRYYNLLSKFIVGLKPLLHQGLSEPEFYRDYAYRLKKIVGYNNFSAQFIKIISHYEKISYNINALQQTACLVVNTITVAIFAFLFNCTPAGQTSASMIDWT